MIESSARALSMSTPGASRATEAPVTCASVRELRIFQRSGNPDLSLPKAPEDGRMKTISAAHPSSGSLSSDLATDDSRVSGEHPLPGTVADHDDARWKDGVFARTNSRPSAGWTPSASKSFCSSSANDGLRLGAVEVVEALGACRRNMAEGLRSVVPIEETRRRNPFTVLGMIALREPQRHDPLGVSMRRFEAGCRRRRDGHCAADADRQNNHGSVEISGRRLSMRMA